MKQIVPILLLAAAGIAVSSCKEEKKPVDIVAKIPVKRSKPSGPQKREPSHWSQTVDWLGQKYTISIDRTPDSMLVTNAAGQAYYENHAVLTVKRADGSTFFTKTFRKADFASAVKGETLTKGTLLGMVFDRVNGQTLVFGASVGDPNPDSDEFVPLSIELTNRGVLSIHEASLGVEGSDDEAMND